MPAVARGERGAATSTRTDDVPAGSRDALVAHVDGALTKLGLERLSASERASSDFAPKRPMPERDAKRPGHDAWTSSGPTRGARRRGVEPATLARAIVDDIEGASDVFATAKVISNGANACKVILTTKSRVEAMRELGLRQCPGCFKFFALHGGGLRNHWLESSECEYVMSSGHPENASDEEDDSSVSDHSWRGTSGLSKPPGWTSHRRTRRSQGPPVIPPDVHPDSVTDVHGSTALMWAAGSGKISVMDYLVNERGADVSHVGARKDGRTPLHWAARNGRLEACEWLLERDPKLANTPSFDGDYPFHLAVWKTRHACASFLAERASGSTSARNRWGCNAVLWACTADVGNDDQSRRDVLRMVRWLVEDLDVPFDVVNVNGHSALHKCAIYGHANVVDYLLGKLRCVDVVVDDSCSSGDDGDDLKKKSIEKMILQDDRRQAPSDLARVNGFLELSAALRAIEDQALRLPVVFGGVKSKCDIEN
ncbi:Ankyrin repeat [Ostreococcus tauri]|uniref:Ankyrin repeat n=1 Tax=Ostreococcus tauri TaxID=70448 RepID=A0A096P8D5_OSTTA|nr:Ankyrin repeat [Ostreococcus tauri]CEG00510.1 Ankyrin repeat [Ostreococcus tauri]|eukprot:XP_003083804.2 Ankyrin repeat [Ostreococcus tauri]